MPDPDLSRHGSLDPDVTFLDHGSVGAVPVRFQVREVVEGR